MACCRTSRLTEVSGSIWVGTFLGSHLKMCCNISRKAKKESKKPRLSAVLGRVPRSGDGWGGAGPAGSRGAAAGRLTGHVRGTPRKHTTLLPTGGKSPRGRPDRGGQLGHHNNTPDPRCLPHVSWRQTPEIQAWLGCPPGASPGPAPSRVLTRSSLPTRLCLDLLFL